MRCASRDCEYRLRTTAERIAEDRPVHCGQTMNFATTFDEERYAAAVPMESTITTERAGNEERAVVEERADNLESAEVVERAIPTVSTVRSERAGANESSVVAERAEGGEAHLHR